MRNGVGVIVLNNSNKVFVGKRKDNPGDKWQMPQGGVDVGESFINAMQEIQDAKIFTQKVVKVIKQHDILRLKGFVAVKGKPLRLTIQAVGPRVDSYFDKSFGINEERATKIVVIGQKGMSQSKIKEALIR